MTAARRHEIVRDSDGSYWLVRPDGSRVWSGGSFLRREDAEAFRATFLTGRTNCQRCGHTRTAHSSVLPPEGACYMPGCVCNSFEKVRNAAA